MISVIIPVYNSERFLRECIDSVLGQSFVDWELIIVDDGSTDGSARIADEYGRSSDKIRVFHNENRGPGLARNFAIDLAQGEYITFVDADDCLMPDSLKILHDAMVATEADVAIGNHTSGKSFKMPKRYSSRMEIHTNIEALQTLLYQTGFSSAPWGKLYRRDSFDKVRFSHYHCYEDLHFLALLFLECRTVVYVDATVYFYRENPASLINTWSAHQLEALEVTESIERMVAREAPDVLDAAADRSLSANFNIFRLAEANGRNEVSRECWEKIKRNRTRSLFNRRVRLKNRVGVLLSYLGSRVFSAISRRVH